MNKYILLLVMLVIVSCGKKENETVTNTVQVPSATTDLLQQIINQTNAYRLSSGQLPLTQGLTCSLYNVSATTPASIPAVLPAVTATYTYNGGFNNPDSSNALGVNILPQALRSTYTNWYVVRCTGNIFVTDNTYHTFYLTSDDGSTLSLDGVVLIDNNGNHSVQTKSGTKLLQQGVHSFSLTYMQSTGNQALVLEDENGLVSSDRFYR